MTSFKGHCDKKAKKIDEFLSDNPDPNPEDLQVLKKLNADLEDQLKRMEMAWESMMADVDDDTFKALDKMLNEVSVEVSKTLATSNKTISLWLVWTKFVQKFQKCVFGMDLTFLYTNSLNKHQKCHKN